MPPQESATALLDGSDPAAVLSVLGQSGNSVRRLGTASIGGAQCTGYVAQTSERAVTAAARMEFAAEGLSAAAANRELLVIEKMPSPAYTVWFDAQGLLRRISVSIQTSSPVSDTGPDLVMDFSDYGAPVRITAPAASNTVGYASLVQMEANSG